VDEACARVVRPAETTPVASDVRAAMEPHYVRYRRVYHALRDVYEPTIGES
jgi:hypothetical protein